MIVITICIPIKLYNFLVFIFPLALYTQYEYAIVLNYYNLQFTFAGCCCVTGKLKDFLIERIHIQIGMFFSSFGWRDNRNKLETMHLNQNEHMDMRISPVEFVS